MRIAGYVILIASSLFLILFAMAELGGGHVGVLPFFISVFLAAMGWSFVKSGRAIVQVQVPAGASAEPTTVEMPMFPGIAMALAQQNARDWRRVLYVAGGFIVVFAVIGALIDLLNAAPEEGTVMLGVFGGLGVVTAAIIAGISWLAMRLPVKRDLRAAHYLRTTGPMQIVAIPFSSGVTLRLADRAFLLNGTAVIRALGSISRGTVDYSPHGHVILAAWDSQGRKVYGAPGYHVELSV